MKLLHALGICCITTCTLAGALNAQNQVVAWGDNETGESLVPVLPPGLDCVELDASFHSSLACLSDGSLVAWGDGGGGVSAVPALPPGLSYSQVAAYYFSAAAVRSDGSIVTWGSTNGTVPVLPPGLTYTQVAQGYFHCVAILSDGTLAAWGEDNWGQTDVPAAPPGLSFVEVAAGLSFSLGRLSDGSVLAWGRNDLGQCNVPALPAGLTYAELAAGAYFTAARRSDGSVVQWGWLSGNLPVFPPGLTCVEIATGFNHGLARMSDGSVLAWGANNKGQCNVPALPAGYRYAEIAGGGFHSLARRETVFACGSATNYCLSTPNSSGQAARILVSGSLAITDDATSLDVFGCPPGKLGLCLCGANTAQIPMADGYLCISSSGPGFFRMGPTALIDAWGHAQHSIDFSAPPAAGQLIPGSTWNFQFWFRDLPAGGAGSNLSDAVQVTFCP